MVIRTERSSDYETVYNLVKRAFERAEHRDGNEQDLVDQLRKSDAFVPQLSLVSESDSKIVGHILFTKIHIGSNEALALAPLAVSPEHQCQGIGMALIKEGHKIAKELGFQYSVVLGSENYYPKAGYIPAINLGIKAPFEVPEQNFMAIDLYGGNAIIEGVVEYAKEFGI